MADAPRYRALERRGEEICDEMYRTAWPRGLLSEIRECFEAAIVLAQQEGPASEARRLRDRLEHIETVYRKHFG